MVNFNNNYDELNARGLIPIVQKLQSQDGTVIVLGKSDRKPAIKLLTYFYKKLNIGN